MRKKLEWHTEKRKLKDLKEWKENPRTITRERYLKLKERIKQRGFHDIIKIDTDNTILSGNHRKKALEELGVKEVECKVPNRKLTNSERVKVALESNIQDATWTDDLFNFSEEDLLDVGLGKELEEMWEQELSVENDEFNVEKAIKEIEKPSVRTGDIYQLGDSKLMCADSTKKENVLKLLGNEKVDMIFNDPPYNIGLDYSKGVSTSTKYRKDFSDLGYKGFKDTKKEGEYKEFLDKTIKNALQVAKKDVHIFYWCDQANIWMLQQLFKENGIHNRRVVLWIKNNFNMTPQVAFNKVYKPCVYGTIGKPYLNNKITNLNEILNKEVTSGVAVLDEILDIIDIWLVKRAAIQEYQHPTMKPITLCEKPMRRCTKPGDLILDLFGGSGSTLIAAEQLKRKAYLIEADPIFCEVCLRRFFEFTGIKPKKVC